MKEMKLKLYNTQKRKKELFVPNHPDKVGLYSCGPTTYDFLHVGNARALVVGDLINRVLKEFGYNVTFVRNFTDVDDKIIKRANERGIGAVEHAQEFINECLKDMEELEMIPATHTPKVSEHMQDIIDLVQSLIAKGHAYETEGEVFFHVPSFEGYGKLSKKDLDSLEHGIRVEVDQRKKHPSDFVLWKPSKEGEPAWDSPWGKGRPGWHIECSAMSKHYLGDTLDIHHGGVDLIFPHHENEIAQSEAANSCSYCNCWVHNEFLNFGTEKMSKSLGNVVTIRSFIEKFSGMILRNILLSAHYRSRLEWSDEVVKKAMQDVERIHQFVKDIKAADIRSEEADEKTLAQIQDAYDKFRYELSNDINTSGAMAQFFSFLRDVRRDLLKENTLPSNTMIPIMDMIQLVQRTLGLIHDDPEQVLNRLQEIKKEMALEKGSLLPEEVEKLLEERKEARATKDWTTADKIRDTFQEKGIEVKDNPDGTTTWFYR